MPGGDQGRGWRLYRAAQATQNLASRSRNRPAKTDFPETSRPEVRQHPMALRSPRPDAPSGGGFVVLGGSYTATMNSPQQASLERHRRNAENGSLPQAGALPCSASRLLMQDRRRGVECSTRYSTLGVVSTVKNRGSQVALGPQKCGLPHRSGGVTTPHRQIRNRES